MNENELNKLLTKVVNDWKRNIIALGSSAVLPRDEIVWNGSNWIPIDSLYEEDIK